jgi:hypothetical protein
MDDEEQKQFLTEDGYVYVKKELDIIKENLLNCKQDELLRLQERAKVLQELKTAADPFFCPQEKEDL